MNHDAHSSIPPLSLIHTLAIGIERLSRHGQLDGGQARPRLLRCDPCIGRIARNERQSASASSCSVPKALTGESKEVLAHSCPCGSLLAAYTGSLAIGIERPSRHGQLDGGEARPWLLRRDPCIGCIAG